VALERMQEILSPFRSPEKLTIKTESNKREHSSDLSRHYHEIGIKAVSSSATADAARDGRKRMDSVEQCKKRETPRLRAPAMTIAVP
jgi:hypothetical protein